MLGVYRDKQPPFHQGSSLCEHPQLEPSVGLCAGPFPRPRLLGLAVLHLSSEHCHPILTSSPNNDPSALPRLLCPHYTAPQLLVTSLSLQRASRAPCLVLLVLLQLPEVTRLSLQLQCGSRLRATHRGDPAVGRPDSHRGGSSRDSSLPWTARSRHLSPGPELVPPVC